MDFVMNYVALYLRLFFLLTPFFVLGTFITLTQDATQELRVRLAWRIAVGASCVTLIIFLVGTFLMKLFGITVDAFRMGSGVLLLLTSVALVQSRVEKHEKTSPEQLLDMAVVPLSVPITAGPATLGTLMVMGTSTTGVLDRVCTSISIVLACFSIGLLLRLSQQILKLLGHANILILSKITGLILSAIAMQMILTGAKNMWMAP